MRPARKGPETAMPFTHSTSSGCSFNEAGPQGAGNVVVAALVPGGPGAASMRPARKGPETNGCADLDGFAAGRFNEAGPQGAGNAEHVIEGSAWPSQLQ